jgi:hypothetical protein
VGVAVVLAGCSTPQPGADGEVLPVEKVAPLVAALPDRPSDLAMLARPDGTAAPTNRWYSGLAFGDGTNPVFPMPISFQLVPGGFAFGVPDVVGGEAGVTAPAVADVTVLTGTDSAQLVRWDDVSVTVALSADGEPRGEVTIAR